MLTKKDMAVIWAMRKHGGGFVQQLGLCFLFADENNFERLQRAFPEYWKTYSEWADLRLAEEPE